MTDVLSSMQLIGSATKHIGYKLYFWAMMDAPNVACMAGNWGKLRSDESAAANNDDE